MPYAELNRRLENMIRIGTISEVDYVARRVRVQSGELTTNWLKWHAGRAGATRTWCPPTLGEQVMILSPSGEVANGVVMPSIYSDAHDAPSSDPAMHVIAFPDGAAITYNHDTGALSASGVQTATVQATQSVTIDTPQAHFTGAVTVDQEVLVKGLLTYEAGMQGSGGVGASATITGTIDVIGDVTINGIHVLGHNHSDAQGGDVGPMK